MLLFEPHTMMPPSTPRPHPSWPGRADGADQHGAVFRSAQLDPPELIGPRKIKKGKRLLSGARCIGSFQHNPGGHMFPEGDQQLSRQGNDQHFPNSATIELCAL